MRGIRILTTVLVILMLVPLALAQSQKPATGSESAPKYDSANEIKVKATIEEVIEAPNAILRLTVKQGAETLEVRLCPHSFLKDMEVSFAKGDQIEITGSKIKVDGKAVILAREIVSGNSTLVLRDKEGTPVWTWLKKS